MKRGWSERVTSRQINKQRGLRLGEEVREFRFGVEFGGGGVKKKHQREGESGCKDEERHREKKLTSAPLQLLVC